MNSSSFNGPAGALHLWQADLMADHLTWLTAEASLSTEEKTRQARFHTPALQRTYGRAHGFLREIISQYTNQSASTLAFNSDPHGKPGLPGSGLYFNLAYRPGRALLAVSDAGPVGVDIELLRRLPDAQALVAQLFAPAEQAALRAAAPADYWPLFYTIWTRKEAYAKFLGLGLAGPFAAFAVLEPGAGGLPVLTAPAGGRLTSLDLAAGYRAAVATRADAPPLRHFCYPAAATATSAPAYLAA